MLIRDTYKVEIPLLRDRNFLEDGLKRGKHLYVNLNASHSSKLINGRFYSDRGQKQGAITAFTPYQKPVIWSHMHDSNTIARIEHAEWTPITQSYGALFDKKKIDLLSDSWNSGDPQKIYRNIQDLKLTNRSKEWQGTGILKMRIVVKDPKEIENFLNDKYLTYSVGALTDHRWCNICWADWVVDGRCEHNPGSLYDNVLCIQITDSYSVKELSVENFPADEQAFTTFMELKDSEEKEVQDGCLNIEETNMKDLFDRAFAALKSGELTIESVQDALAGDTIFEVIHLIKMHDALHAYYDWELRWNEKDRSIPNGVFSLHGKLHDLAIEKSFRDSIMNGELDKFNSVGVKNNEYILAEKVEPVEDKASLHKKMVETLALNIEGLNDSDFLYPTEKLFVVNTEETWQHVVQLINDHENIFAGDQIVKDRLMGLGLRNKWLKVDSYSNAAVETIKTEMAQTLNAFKDQYQKEFNDLLQDYKELIKEYIKDTSEAAPDPKEVVIIDKITNPVKIKDNDLEEPLKEKHTKYEKHILDKIKDMKDTQKRNYLDNLLDGCLISQKFYNSIIERTV